jgi:hypothetical protein
VVQGNEEFIIHVKPWGKYVNLPSCVTLEMHIKKPRSNGKSKNGVCTNIEGYLGCVH